MVSESHVAKEKKVAWRGIMTSPGVAIGPALLYTQTGLALHDVERRIIAAEQITVEQERLRQALDMTVTELQALATSVQQRIGQAEAAIFEAQVLMLQDPALGEAALKPLENSYRCRERTSFCGQQQASTLEALDSPLLAARAADVRDVVGRTLLHLSGQVMQKQDFSKLQQPVILLADDLTPSDTALLKPETVLGICTVQGGPTAHAAILARALGIPAMAGLSQAALQSVQTGDELGLDADNALLYHRPDTEMQVQLQQRFAERQQQRAALLRTVQQVPTAVSIDERRIHLLANIGNEAEAEAARQWGAEGIGLLRTEFLFAATSPFLVKTNNASVMFRYFALSKGMIRGAMEAR